MILCMRCFGGIPKGKRILCPACWQAMPAELHEAWAAAMKGCQNDRNKVIKLVKNHVRATRPAHRGPRTPANVGVVSAGVMLR